MQREISLDFETKCELDVTKVGLDVYSSHPSCAVQMCSWTWDRGRTVFQWTEEDGTPFPQEVISALEDPSVIKRAFNAQFERIIARRVLKIKTPYKGWRCTMVMAYMLSFVGGLEQVGAQMGIDDAHLKNGKRGKYLVRNGFIISKVTGTLKTRPPSRITGVIALPVRIARSAAFSNAYQSCGTSGKFSR